MDNRAQTLAHNLINYSLKLKEGEKLLIQTYGHDFNITKELIKECYKAGGKPFLFNDCDELTKLILDGCDDEQMKILYQNKLELMKQMDAYIAIYGYSNSNELANVLPEKIQINSKQSQGYFEERVNNTRWCIICAPTFALAQAANMSTDNFEEFFYKVCNLDYSKMDKAMDNLVNVINKTDKVRICGNGSDLTFSVKNVGAVKCAGEANIPDGEVYTAPVKNSVNGYIQYNTPSVYNGKTYENIRLEFKDGKITKAISNDTEGINKIFDTDEGARFVGEFALGVNPYITSPVKDILFDEKISGSIHFTPGGCYEGVGDNGNHSSIHWDLVLIQTPEFGGGEIYFDDVLIRKDGKFIVENLKCLNPENLI